MQDFDTIPISQKDKLKVRFLYRTPLGRILLWLLIRKSVSNFFGFMMNRRVSKLSVKRFAKKNKINMSECEEKKFKSFNSFFKRKLKNESRPFSQNIADFCAPCDGKLTAYEITESSVFNVKNSKYQVADLLKDDELADKYMGGTCLIFRLTPDDYHRYFFVDDGEIIKTKKIKGVLHTVRPIVHKRYKVFTKNAREWTLMRTNNFGEIVQVEVGALFVGKIKNIIKSGTFGREEQKGMFEFGGSTIIMLLQKDAVKISDDILQNTKQNKETVIKLGNVIGTK